MQASAVIQTQTQANAGTASPEARGPRRGRPCVHREGSAVSTADNARDNDRETAAREAAALAPAPHEGTEPPRLRLIRGEGSGARQLALPLEYEVAPGVPAIPPVPAHLHLVTDAPAMPEGLPPAGLWTARLARAIVEVAQGERPAAQLAGHLSRDQLTRLTLRGNAVARHPSSRQQRGATRMRQVRGVRVCPVAPGIVETSAVLIGGQRAQAIALRLEAVGQQWLATAVELG